MGSRIQEMPIIAMNRIIRNKHFKKTKSKILTMILSKMNLKKKIQDKRAKKLLQKISLMTTLRMISKIIQVIRPGLRVKKRMDTILEIVMGTELI